MEYKYRQLAETENIPNAWTRWRAYRGRLTEHILRALDGGERRAVAIYGAGRCNDVDVRRLLDAGVRVALFDCDVETVRQAAREHGFAGEVEIGRLDLFPVREEEYWEFEESLQRGEEAAGICRQLYRVLSRVMETGLEVPSRDFGLNVCVGVHSQVLIRFICLLQLYGCHDAEGRIAELLRWMNQCMVKRFHDAMFKAGHGDVLIGYEYGTFAPGEAEKIKSLFEHGKAGRVAEMKLSRVSGAYEAEQDIAGRLGRGLMLAGYRYDVWKLLESKEYLMVFYHLV